MWGMDPMDLCQILDNNVVKCAKNVYYICARATNQTLGTRKDHSECITLILLPVGKNTYVPCLC